MLGGVWLIYFGFGLLSVVMAPLVEPISRDLGLSYTTMGAILGAWPLVYIVAAAPCGAFVDRVGLKWSLLLAVLVIAASGGLRAVAFDAGTLFVAVGLFGIGGPLISIGAPKAIAQWFQGAERGFAMGVYITGPALGNMLALMLTNSVLMPLTGGNWRQVLLIYAGFILATGLAWFLLGSHPINRVVERAGRRRATVAGQMAVFATLLRLPNIQVILAISHRRLLLSPCAQQLAAGDPAHGRHGAGCGGHLVGGAHRHRHRRRAADPEARDTLQAVHDPVRTVALRRRGRVDAADRRDAGAGGGDDPARHRPRLADRRADPGPDGNARR